MQVEVMVVLFLSNEGEKGLLNTQFGPLDYKNAFKKVVQLFTTISESGRVNVTVTDLHCLWTFLPSATKSFF